jgi:hypothetical protein
MWCLWRSKYTLGGSTVCLMIQPEKVPYYHIGATRDPVRWFSLFIIIFLLVTCFMPKFRYWIAYFPPSLTLKQIQIQIQNRPGPRVMIQLMTTWWVTRLGLQGPELANARLSILLHRRIPGRKCRTSHQESILMNRLWTHLLLQHLQKVPREGTISADPTGRLNWNLPLAGFFFLTSPIVQEPAWYLSKLLCEKSWVK